MIKRAPEKEVPFHGRTRGTGGLYLFPRIIVGKSRGIALWRGFGGIPHLFKIPQEWGI
jgi:hypothetical protein